MKLFVVLFLLILPVHAADKITVLRPLEGEMALPGEVNFQWERPEGDASRVVVIVEDEKSGSQVLYRRTIGTRRTKTLGPGSYRWRLFGNKNLDHSNWIHFTVGNPSTSPIPDEGSAIKVINQQRTETKKEVADNTGQHHPEGVKKVRVERHSRDIETSIGEAPQPDMVGGGLSLVRDYILKSAKYPKTVEFNQWHEIAARRINGELYWVSRVQFRGRNSFGGLHREDVVVLIRNGQIVSMQNSCQAGFDCEDGF